MEDDYMYKEDTWQLLFGRGSKGGSLSSPSQGKGVLILVVDKIWRYIILTIGWSVFPSEHSWERMLENFDGRTPRKNLDLPLEPNLKYLWP
jgi:hypothetical protein